MDRRNYDRQVISLFDTLGGFFVDIFYNDLYLKAKSAVKEGKFGSITDAYRANILNYMNGIKLRNLYTGVVKKLHEYYQRITGFSSLVFADFEDKVLVQFIPAEYYGDFTNKHKDSALYDIIVRTVNESGAIVLMPDFLRRAIDDHMNVRNVTLLQDKLVDVFIFQREDYYTKFVSEINRKNCGGEVSKEVVEKLKAAFVEEKRARVKAESDRDRAVFMIAELMKKIRDFEDQWYVPDRQHVESHKNPRIAQSLPLRAPARNRAIAVPQPIRTSPRRPATPWASSQPDDEETVESVPFIEPIVRIEEIDSEGDTAEPPPEKQPNIEQSTLLMDEFVDSTHDSVGLIGDDPGFG